MAENDIVIFDSPHAAFVGDAAVLSTRVDGVVFVVSGSKTRRDTAKRAVFNLKQAGANILGVVLNRAPSNGGRYSYYTPEDQEVREGNRVYAFLHRIRKKATFSSQP